ncbi:hypothetical protein D3C72_1983780 [compost metagenome]
MELIPHEVSIKAALFIIPTESTADISIFQRNKVIDLNIGCRGIVPSRIRISPRTCCYRATRARIANRNARITSQNFPTSVIARIAATIANPRTKVLSTLIAFIHIAKIFVVQLKTQKRNQSGFQFLSPLGVLSKKLFTSFERI